MLWEVGLLATLDGVVPNFRRNADAKAGTLV